MAEKLTSHSEKMGTMPVGRLLITMAAPMMVSMLTQAFYNVVDSVYVARVSEESLSALSLVFPAQNLMIGIGTGTGVGIGTLIARALGAGDNARANKIAGNSVFLMVCCWAMMFLFGLLGAERFVCGQTDDPLIREAGVSYLRIVTMGSFFLYAEMGFNRLLQSTGLTNKSMWGQFTGAVTNIILDPFFIFGWCGLPAMGTAGAAIATVIGQIVGTTVAIALNLRYNRELHITLRDVLPEGRLIAAVYRIAFPSILMMAVGSVMNYMMNGILISFTATAVAVFGVYFKLQSFAFLPVFGLNNAMIPIIGYNYGARDRERIYSALRYSVLFAVSFMLLAMLIFQLFPRTLLGLFNASGNMLAIGVPALRRISMCFIFAGFCIVSGSACQALEMPMASLITSILRQVVVLVPAAMLLARSGDVSMVWWAFPIAEVMSLLASAFFLRRALRKLDRHFAETAEVQA